MSEIKIFERTTLTKFRFENKVYTHRYIATSSSGLGWILYNNEIIYSPYPKGCTDEGNRVYYAYMASNNKMKLWHQYPRELY